MIALIVILLIYVGYGPNWLLGSYSETAREISGFGEITETKDTTHFKGATNPDGSTVSVDRTEDPRRAKTFWDWLQILVVPLVVTIVGLWFNRRQQARQASDETERDRAATFQAYIDEMGKLLTTGNLEDHDSPDAKKTRALARARTLTVLERLDPKRKRSVLQFLRESELLQKERPIVELHDANLSDAALSDMSLSGVNLVGVKLSRANLSGAKLSNANLGSKEVWDKWGPQSGSSREVCTLLDRAILSNTILSKADLTKAKLDGADLSNAVLKDADLSSARLREAKGLEQEQINGARGSRSTSLPEGFTYPSSWS